MNEFLHMFGETSQNKLLVLREKSLYIISLNTKIKRLKFLFTSLFKKVSVSSVKSVKFK